ncbi:MAG TPA: hypothetical protein PKO16_02115 [Bacteroidia bacterium]|jgi:hypothetical protein|nr:hypothetical protein [Bacteroidia bacterium]
MKKINHTNNHQNRFSLFLTGCIFASLATGWLLGSMTTKAFSQTPSQKNDDTYFQKTILLPTTSINGEILPTILLKEIIITAQ